MSKSETYTATFLHQTRQAMAEAIDKLDEQIAQLEADKPKKMIIIQDHSALPVGYYLRAAVLNAIRQEVEKDIKADRPVPPGVEIMEVESGKAEEIHETDGGKSNAGAASGLDQDRGNNESKAGGGGKGNNRRVTKNAGGKRKGKK